MLLTAKLSPARNTNRKYAQDVTLLINIPVVPFSNHDG